MGAIIHVDPADLRLPGGRASGADPWKLSRQIARHGDSIESMPPIIVSECADGELEILNGVTRATRAAKLRPGELVPVEIIDRTNAMGKLKPRVGDRL